MKLGFALIDLLLASFFASSAAQNVRGANGDVWNPRLLAPGSSICAEESNIQVLTQADCGRTNITSGTYILQDDVICEEGAGFEFVGPGTAYLDCQGKTIKGPGKDFPTIVNGVTVTGGSLIIENCKIEEFTGNGVKLDVDSGPSMINFAWIKKNGNSISVSNHEDNFLTNIEASEATEGSGIFIDGNGDNIIEGAKLAKNAFDGLRINGNGNNEIYDLVAESNKFNGVVFAMCNNSCTRTLNGGRIKNNEESGVQVRGSKAHLSRLLVEENKDAGINLFGGAEATIKCSSVKNNEKFGLVLVNSVTATVIDSSISETKGKDAKNIEMSTGLASTATFSRVRACKSEGDDVALSTITPPDDLSTLTCDSGASCGFKCEECQVETPSWCKRFD